MSLLINPRSLGFLKTILNEEEAGLCVTEYRDSISSEVKLKGTGVEENKEKIKEAFLSWYPPAGYMSRAWDALSTSGEYVLVLFRYLNCD
jgi:hypothetical protein